MRKNVEIDEVVLKRIMEGKYMQGSLHYNKLTKRLEFTYYHRKRGSKDRLIATLEHGWLKESPKRVKFHLSVKKAIGTARIISAMEREQRTACNFLIDREIVDRV